MSTKLAADVANELEATLTEIESVTKRASNMQEEGGGRAEKSTALTNSGEPDGDRPATTGDRHAENTGDVADQQDLSIEHGSDTANSPEIGTAADSQGDITDVRSPNMSAKDKADDPGTAHPSDVSKEANDVLALASVLEKLGEDDYSEEELGKAMSGDYDKKDYDKKDYDKKDHDKKDYDKGMEYGDPKKPDSENSEKQAGEKHAFDKLAAEDQARATKLAAVLPENADLEKIASLPEIPTDPEALSKLPQEQIEAYVEKVAEVFGDDVAQGYAFGANFVAGLSYAAQGEDGGGAGHGKEAEDQTRAAVVKLAEDDAAAVAELMEGMEQGEGYDEEMPEGYDEEMPEGYDEAGGEGEVAATAGGEDAAAAALAAEAAMGGGAGPAGPASEEASTPVSLGGFGPAPSEALGEDELLAALMGAGIGPEKLAKVASAKLGKSEEAVLARLKKIQGKA